MARLLRKFGTCLDVGGLSLEEASLLIKSQQPDGILALADDALEWTAHVAEHLELNFLLPSTVARLTDKFAQRKALRESGLRAPRSLMLGREVTAVTLAALAKDFPFPAVMKPRWGEGSRDTLPVSSIGELCTFWDEVNPSDGARDFVLEEYIPDSPVPMGGSGFASYVSVESFVQQGVITHLAVTGRMPPAAPFRETGFFIPCALDAEQQQTVLDVAGQAAAAVGVTLGCLHTEIKLTPAGPTVIEVNGRIGGGIPEMLEAATGVKFLSIAMRLALGEAVEIPAMPHCDALAYLFYVQAPVEFERVTALEGLSELREVAGVDEVILNRGPGERVDWREGNHGHVFSVFGTAADHDQLRHVKDLIPALVRIVGE